MNLTQRVAASAALLASLSAGATAAYPEDFNPAPTTNFLSVAPLQRAPVSMSGFDLTPSTLTLSSGTLLPSTPLMSAAPLTLPSNVSATSSLLLGQTQGSVAAPSNVNLIPAKPRTALPAYMLRDYRKSPTETAASAR